MMSGFVKIDNYVDDGIRNAKRRAHRKAPKNINGAVTVTGNTRLAMEYERGRLDELNRMRRFLDRLFGRID